MAQPWKPIVEQLRNPAPQFDLPPQKTPTPSAWTRDQLRVASRAATSAAAPVAPTAAPAAVAPAAEATGAKSTGWFKRTANALRNPMQAMPTVEGAGRFAGSAVRTALPAAAGLHTVSHLNDFKINDPTNDSSAGGTFKALRNMGVGDAARLLNPAAALGAVAGGGLGDLGRSLSKGALEAGMDLGSAAANVADIFVPGKAPVSTAYNSMLREKFGDQLVDRTGTAPAAPAAPTASAVNPNYGNEQLRAPVAPQPPANVVTRTGNSFSGTDIKPGFTYADGSQGKGTVTSLDTSEGHRQNLLELQRNAAERANAPAPAGAAGIGGAGSTTFSQDLRAKTNAGQTPSGLSPYDAAQLQQQRDQTQQQGDIARAQIGVSQSGNANQLRVAEMNNATQRENNAATTRTALAGHEMDLRGRMAPLEYAEARRRAMSAAYQPGKDGGAVDHITAADRLDKAGFREEAAAARTAASQNQAIKGAGNEQERKGHADLVELFRGDDRFHAPDPKDPSKTVFDSDGAKRAAAALYAEHGEKLDTLSPADKKKAASEIVALQRLQDRLRQPEMSAFDHVKNWVGQYQRPADNMALPDLRGAKAERRGATLIPGNMTNDTLLRMPNGQTYNAGVLSEPETAVLRERGVGR